MTATTTNSTPPAEQEVFLQALLSQAFKPSSTELRAYIHLSSASLVPDSTTAREIGLASAYAAVRRYLCDEYGLLGGGWAEFMIQPDGGDEILACCVRYAQDSIHTFLSYSGGHQLQNGGYAAAKEVARQALVRALIRTGDLVQVGSSKTEAELDRARASWGRRVWHAEDEGSILEIPHLSPSLGPMAASPSLLSDPLESSPFFAQAASSPPAECANPPPHTPADSPLLRPIVLPIVDQQLAHGYDRLLDGELDEGEKTPTNRPWALPLDA